MKILFLDVDGVLNRLDRQGEYLETTPAPWMTGHTVVDLNIVAMFNHVTAQVPGLKIVVSSTWRSYAANREQFCAMTGVVASLIHDDWRTPAAAFRGAEIEEWLGLHTEVESYAIVDDLDDGIAKIHGKRFIRVPCTTGLNLDQTDRWLKIFGYRIRRKDFTVVTLGGPVESTLIIPDSAIQRELIIDLADQPPTQAPGWKMPDAFEE
jgi:hypothetical protein